MSWMILACVVLCSLLFVVYTLVGYFETAGPLKQSVPQMRKGVEAKKARLEDYEVRIIDLQDLIPREEVRHARMAKWVDLLTEQNNRLKALEAERLREEMAKQVVITKGST